jgi:hypothetical protein
LSITLLDVVIIAASATTDDRLIAKTEYGPDTKRMVCWLLRLVYNRITASCGEIYQIDGNRIIDINKKIIELWNSRHPE